MPLSYVNAPAGTYYPRIYRPGSPWPVNAIQFRAITSAATSFQLLCERLASILRVIELSPRNDKSFGHEIRRELIVACTDVEAGLAGALRANRYPGERWGTNDYVKLAGPLGLDAYSVSIGQQVEYREVAPFKGWKATGPTASLDWYSAYNRTKHDRELRLKDATLGRLLRASAASFIVAVAQFGEQILRPGGGFTQELFRVSDSPQLMIDQYSAPVSGKWRKGYLSV